MKKIKKFFLDLLAEIDHKIRIKENRLKFINEYFEHIEHDDNDEPSCPFCCIETLRNKAVQIKTSLESEESETISKDQKRNLEEDYYKIKNKINDILRKLGIHDF